MLNESYLLEYGSEGSLDFIKEHKNEIAAVLVEPVQSRYSSFQPREYLQELRTLTTNNNIALIFDEVITGFRAGIGGAQEHFDVTADIVTYGKVIGGGLPIGVVAGKAKFLDATDGGFWQYGDDSVPSVKPTFVAGTFCHHPLAMAASLKTLEILNRSNGKLLKDLNKTTEAFCSRLNSFFIENGYQLSVNNFASLFRFHTPGKSNLLYYQLLLNGVYVWEGRNCFLSPAYPPQVLAALEEKIKLSCLQLEDLYINLINEDSKKLLSGLHLYNGVDCSSTISLHHLLSHSSGLRDYFSGDERFLSFVLEHPLQSWDWKGVMGKYFEFGLHKKPAFIPGEGFHYADTNYLLLAVLIKQITGKTLHQVYREKMISPLGLTDTYLEFYEMPDEIKPVVYPFYGIHSLEKVATSFDWGGGGLVSTMNDLDIFIRSLMKGVLFKKPETLDLMLQVQNQKPSTESTGRLFHYGLGIQKKDFSGFSFFGHNSAYGSMLYYEPEKDISIILSLNQLTAMHKAEWMMKKIISELKI